MVVHLGDGASDFTKTLPDNYEKPFVAIEGNGEYYGFVGADRRYRPKRTETVEFEGKKIFMTHGHLYDVKYGLSRLIAAGYEKGADIILFGHTHGPISKYIPAGTTLDYIGETDRPLLVFNPGSIGMGPDYSFGVLGFSGGEVLASHGKF
jgi:predicted phosphodiesterase